MQSRSHRVCAILFAAASALAVLTGTTAAQDKTFHLKLAHWVPPSHPLQKALEDWGASVEKASNGTIKSTVFPAQQLGKVFDHYDMAFLTGLGIGIMLMVRRHYCDDGRTRLDPSAGRHEHFRYQERHRRCKNFRDVLRRVAVYRHRYPAACNPCRISRYCVMATVATVKRFDPNHRIGHGAIV